ncbi:hypothetical protein JQ600_35520 [Bradyrhizobium sp. AUGA SZCCT0176]|uniref:hypothetical protein n=1 Tax=Bradyrhizobium sp. AUGA SZCCT0176 TaxID=2807664 RepID=UPI001BAA910A|nr:hypothetical protein [Bradyrhizobium sp. AUGA SZCCT0176]MBR1230207.1 hypothetical protein [Bradyrhizobium sp. AUGA SZCCT0176]
MTDLSVTAANVLPGAGATTDRGLAGGTITAGMTVYKAADGTIVAADADSATVLARTPIGVALNSASAGQPVDYQKSGSITIGATMTAGVTYYQSGGAGLICPLADVSSSEYLCIVGIATSTTVLKLSFNYSGVLGT